MSAARYDVTHTTLGVPTHLCAHACGEPPREGITSPREVHCRFRSAEKSDTGWKVQADCEEAGEASPAEIAVTTSSDGTVSILSEDVYGPEALKFTPCQK